MRNWWSRLREKRQRRKAERDRDAEMFLAAIKRAAARSRGELPELPDQN